jgi:hypothetical protein
VDGTGKILERHGPNLLPFLSEKENYLVLLFRSGTPKTANLRLRCPFAETILLRLAVEVTGVGESRFVVTFVPEDAETDAALKLLLRYPLDYLSKIWYTEHLTSLTALLNTMSPEQETTTAIIPMGEVRSQQRAAFFVRFSPEHLEAGDIVLDIARALGRVTELNIPSDTERGVYVLGRRQFEAVRPRLEAEGIKFELLERLPEDAGQPGHQSLTRR